MNLASALSDEGLCKAVSERARSLFWNEEKRDRVESLVRGLQKSSETRATLEEKASEMLELARPLNIFRVVNSCSGEPEKEWGEHSTPFLHAKELADKFMEIMELVISDNDQHLQLLSQNLQETLSI